MMLAATLLPLGVAVPASASTVRHADAACPGSMFFGAHGVNEGSGGTAARKNYWGPEMDQVWQGFHREQLNSTAASVNYPRVTLGPTAPRIVLLWGAGSQIVPITIQGVRSLESQLKAEAAACPGTLLVLAGFSQGAWVIDGTLHKLHRDDPALLRNIAGVYLMGDPAWPKTAQTPSEFGIAVHFLQGYPTANDYFNNGIPRNSFLSLCIGDDPICHYDGSYGDYKVRLHIHMQDYLKDMPGRTYTYGAYGGAFLAARV
jgi:hypothetical protein